MQVMWMVMETLGLALVGVLRARRGKSRNRLGQAPVSSHRPVLWSSGPVSA
jgi:hypothetical protein